jgi:hypothetical protein
VAATTGEILAFIDADCLADPAGSRRSAPPSPIPRPRSWAATCASPMPTRPGLTMLEAYESIYAYRMDRYIAEQGFTGTGNLAVRRHVLEAVGPFRGLDVAEDRDWGQRATRAGHDLRYVPGMRVYHPARHRLFRAGAEMGSACRPRLGRRPRPPRRGLARIRLYRARRMASLLAGADPARLSGAWNRG